MSRDFPRLASFPDSHSKEFSELVYKELRKLATSKMSKELAYSTLQGTALVHEAWLKLGGDGQPRWESRAHFFASASEAMRRILIDRARKRKVIRHGGNMHREDEDSLNSVAIDSESDDQLLQINDVLERFSRIDPKKAELVKLRFYIGLNIEEASTSLGISVTTAKRWWVYSKSWIYREMKSS